MSTTVSGLSHALTETLMRVGRELKTLQNPWWILGSSAIAILGYEAGPIGDVDILVSERDAVHLMSAHGLVEQRRRWQLTCIAPTFFCTPRGDRCQLKSWQVTRFAGQGTGSALYRHQESRSRSVM